METSNFNRMSVDEKHSLLSEVNQIVLNRANWFLETQKPTKNDMYSSVNAFVYKLKDSDIYFRLWFCIYICNKQYWWNPIMSEEISLNEYLDDLNKNIKNAPFN